jgi:hypothetical protein
MSSKIPPQFEGHESKVEELIFYVVYAKKLFYLALWIIAVNALLTYGLIFHKPGPSPKTCSRYCPLDMNSHTALENVNIPRVNASITPNTTIIAHEVKSKALEREAV